MPRGCHELHLLLFADTIGYLCFCWRSSFIRPVYWLMLGWRWAGRLGYHLGLQPRVHTAVGQQVCCTARSSSSSSRQGPILPPTTPALPPPPHLGAQWMNRRHSYHDHHAHWTAQRVHCPKTTTLYTSREGTLAGHCSYTWSSRQCFNANCIQQGLSWEGHQLEDLIMGKIYILTKSTIDPLWQKGFCRRQHSAAG